MEENKKDEEYLELPNPPKESDLYLGVLETAGYFAYSQRGSSHVDYNKPCQDRCKLVTTKNNVIIAAMADGLGSAALSHYSANMAVHAVCDYLKNEVEQVSNVKEKVNQTFLFGVMQKALDEIQAFTEKYQLLAISFDTTLTIAVYVDKTLYIAHCGDGGVIVKDEDGKIELVTKRFNGEKASSVFPLSAGMTHWQYVELNRPVESFIMATDGVLDSLLDDGGKVNESILAPIVDMNLMNRREVKLLRDDYYNFMNHDVYRHINKDDITLIAVSSLQKKQALCSSYKEAFIKDKVMTYLKEKQV